VSINRSQIDLKRKTCDIRTWKKHLFLDISSANTDTLVPSPYLCAESCRIEVFDCFLSHFRTSVSTSSPSEKYLPPSCEPLYATHTSHRKLETFLYGYFLHWVFLPTKTHNKTLLFGRILLKYGRRFDYRNQPLNMRMNVCYLDLFILKIVVYKNGLGNAHPAFCSNFV
jgi:hypothetical protein